jgi:hypothetical protein
VLVAVTGAVKVAPTGTAAPTTSVSALNVAFTDLGGVLEGGITESWWDDTTDIKDNSGLTVRRLITGTAATLAFTLLESKSDALELYHKGDQVVTDGGTGYKIDVHTPQRDQRSFVFELLDGSTHVRIYVPIGEVTDRGEITYTNDGSIQYPITVTAYPTTAGVLMTKFSDSSAWA